jgi:peptidoglycan/LPS O-acetylase OafA/YrhL
LSGQKSFLYTLKQFYFRRFLRIFPIYYLFLIALLILNVDNLRNSFLWHFLYLSNIYFFIANCWQGSISHLWTLAVEEQFYMIWPWLILLIPSRHILKTIVLFIIVAIIYRFTANLYLNFFSRLLTPACFDAFGLGALLAWQDHSGGGNNVLWKILDQRKIILIVSIIFYLFLTYVIPKELGTIIKPALLKFVISVISLALISLAIGENSKFMQSVFGNKPVVYIGKISYGIYLYHNIFTSFTIDGLNPVLMFAVKTCLLLALSTVSWFLIEKPLISLKRYFAY